MSSVSTRSVDASSRWNQIQLVCVYRTICFLLFLYLLLFSWLHQRKELFKNGTVLLSNDKKKFNLLATVAQKCNDLIKCLVSVSTERQVLPLDCVFKRAVEVHPCGGWHQVTGSHRPDTHTLLLRRGGCLTIWPISLIVSSCWHSGNQPLVAACIDGAIGPLHWWGLRGDNVPDDGADVGIKLGHQDAGAHNQDVQPQNMEEAETQRTEDQLSWIQMMF